LAELPAAVKTGEWDTVRAVPVEETARRLDAVRSLVGITRVADITGLDVLGVPSAIAVRPSRDHMCMSVYSGKALTLGDAWVGAQMEALEVACGNDDRVPMERATFAGLAAAGRRALHPDSLIPLAGAPPDLAREPLDWVRGWSLCTGAPVLVPADVVYFRRDGRRPYWKVSSNGLASGNSLTEAIAHGLAEVIERDAETMFRVATEYADLPGLLRLVGGPARTAPPPGALRPPDNFPLVDLSTLPDPLRAVTARVEAAGVDTALRVITSDVRVPTLLCAFHEETTDARRHLVHYGAGTHPDAAIAARRAITEAAQSRVTAIQGAREDLTAGAICPSEPPASWFAPASPGIDFRALERVVNGDVRDDIVFMVRALAGAALEEIVVVDVTNESIGFPVVKVIVPGLELAFHAVDPDRVNFGWRSRRYLDGEAAA
jgi:ribosomal protein S12 methylthiotransferase accessory factor